uniref:Uncharacterized protein n=1 Tax=Knipowitschia caucasica TaxID=637954 RepID=A0AAV2KUK7_KNICA
MQLDPLDSCHHRVVSQLKSSCESLSEEQLAKLGVVLFNCQSEIEGRRTYPCTEEMMIKECTASMDPDTWNAYHIVSNRARSVCYATRQMLFRRRAENTVNALISTASTQLDAMKDLKEGQLQLKEMTAASLDRVLEGHSALRDQQNRLYEEQEQMESSLKDNLERLGKEKALIASGQQLVAQLIQGITQKMENVSQHLEVQSSEVHDGHRAIVEDLADVRHQAQDVYQKIDTSMTQFLQYQDQTSQYFYDLMTKLERMNKTLGFVLQYLDNMQGKIEGQLHVIQNYLGWAGHWFIRQFCAFLRKCKTPVLLPLGPCETVEPQKPKPAPLSYPPCSTPDREKNGICLEETIDQDGFILGDLGTSVVSPCHRRIHRESINHSTPKALVKPVLSATHIDNLSLRNIGGVCDAANDSRELVDVSRSASPNPSIISNISLTSRLLCNATTKAGKACKKRAVLGLEYCRVHEGGQNSYVN